MYRIKDWKKHQHYLTRRPPWIKLHRELLDNPAWHELNGDDAKMLVMLWLIASDDEKLSGYLPDSKTLAFRLRMAENDVTACLERLNSWIYLDASIALADCYQDADSEKRREETYKKREEQKPVFKKSKTMDSELAKMRGLLNIENL